MCHIWMHQIWVVMKNKQNYGVDVSSNQGAKIITKLHPKTPCFRIAVLFAEMIHTYIWTTANGCVCNQF